MKELIECIITIKHAGSTTVLRSCSWELRRLKIRSITAEATDIDLVLMSAGGQTTQKQTNHKQKSKKPKRIHSLNRFFKMLQVSKAATDPGSDPCDPCSVIYNK